MNAREIGIDRFLKGESESENRSFARSACARKRRPEPDAG